MILEPLEPDATSEQITVYLNNLHACMEKNFIIADKARTRLASRIKFDGTFNLSATIGLVLALIGLTYRVSQWTSHVDQTLLRISSVVTQTDTNTDAIKDLRTESLVNSAAVAKLLRKKPHDQ